MSHPIRWFYDRYVSPGYDPVYDTVVSNEDVLYQGGRMAVKLLRNIRVKLQPLVCTLQVG